MYLFPGLSNEQSETYSLVNFSNNLRSQKSFFIAGDQDFYTQKVVGLHSSSKIRPYSAKTTNKVTKQKPEAGIVDQAYARQSNLTSGNYASKKDIIYRMPKNNNWVDLPEFTIQVDRYQNQQQNHLYFNQPRGQYTEPKVGRKGKLRSSLQTKANKQTGDCYQNRESYNQSNVRFQSDQSMEEVVRRSQASHAPNQDLKTGDSERRQQQ